MGPPARTRSDRTAGPRAALGDDPLPGLRAVAGREQPGTGLPAGGRLPGPGHQPGFRQRADPLVAAGHRPGCGPVEVPGPASGWRWDSEAEQKGSVMTTERWPAPAGLHMSSARLPDEGRLASFDGATGWLNSPPLTARELSGKTLLVNFWTYTCINWL